MREREAGWATDHGPRLPEDTLFDSRNGFLDLLLGLISLSERTVSIVAELADPLPPPPREPGRPAPPAAPILR